MSAPTTEDIADGLNGDYLALRWYATPLYAIREEADPAAMKEIGGEIFEMGVNAAYAHYVLCPLAVEDPALARRAAHRLRMDTIARRARARRLIRAEWTRLRPTVYYRGEDAPMPVLRNRRETFKRHRQYRPAVLGGEREQAA